MQIWESNQEVVWTYKAEISQTLWSLCLWLTWSSLLYRNKRKDACMCSDVLRANIIAFKTVMMVSSEELVTFLIGFGWDHRPGIERKLGNHFRFVFVRGNGTVLMSIFWYFSFTSIPYFFFFVNLFLQIFFFFCNFLNTAYVQYWCDSFCCSIQGALIISSS